MKVITANIKLAMQGTFFLLFKNYFNSKKKLREISKLDLSQITSYFEKYKKKGNVDRVVLVELFHEHPTVNNNNHIVSLLLSHKYCTETIGFLKYRSCSEVKYVAKKYNVSKFVYVYTWKNSIYRVKAFFSLINSLSKLNYEKSTGWEIKVEGVEIGDLVYDQYLRYTNLPTVRKLTINYTLYIYNAIFYFYRYLDVLKENNVTDVILSHGVYAEYGILARVASSLSRDIKIYQWFNLNPMNVSVHTANKEYVRKPRYYEPNVMERILKNNDRNDLLAEYSHIMRSRMEGDDKNQIDVAFVYKGNEINSKTDFIEQYSPDSNKKNIFIYAHAFVDSVRYSHWSLYSDYYTWLYETLFNLVEESKISNIYIKPHPSESMYKCNVTVKDTIDDINSRYGAAFVYLDKKVHNRVIFNISNTIITSNGTVALEAVCYGIPVLVAGSTLYERADTVCQPNTIDEYVNCLRDIGNIKHPTEETIERAKLCFMFFQKYVYVPASFLRNGYVFSSADRCAEYAEHNKAFGTKVKLEDELLFQAFDYMLEKNENDTIFLDWKASNESTYS
ncbi:hypothetical protein [Vibrio sp. 2-2(8)]|uniref:hypothetical protein n=1 Tax=Vibrio sp. 2-2(8) TaxID=2591014 RepID=UPI0014837B36|nr:hypothetical protein [Vibrio sp. 2-2(8)]NNN48627.1 hypothetical protein [Vibrio sp. 2-2(8)]